MQQDQKLSAAVARELLKALFVSAAHSRAKTHRERGSKLAFWNRGSPVHFFQLHNASDSQSRVRRRTFGGIILLIPLKRHREREIHDSKQALREIEREELGTDRWD